ncbi:hypothetical protein NHN26_07115 [Rhodovulum tesquicola]|uniref:hypothetical protein n=1 Tax=Rhodovulum tesquicola TaxID=540254 RepID=UPI002097770F|nr:hypothetical protein [Rhodovulum tesquicola]MCO8144992.1 hypothetical protein [Rhodovulum tesquicola]
MQIIGPIPAVGIQDSGVTAVSAIAATTTVAATGGGNASGQTRNETGERGQQPPRAIFPAPDPDRPAGPPPTFDTTPLQLEAERRLSEASAFWRSSAPPAEPAQRQLDIEV